jgi:hypothetical protein
VTPRTLKCRECGFEPSPKQFIGGVVLWTGGHLRVADHVCPRCGCREEVVFQYSEVLFGYTYAAGTAHFSAEERASVPGLRSWFSGQSMFVEFEGTLREIPAAA